MASDSLKRRHPDAPHALNPKPQEASQCALSNDKQIVRCWGYAFEWTSHHKTPLELEPLKQTYDKLADDCLDRLTQLPGRKGQLSYHDDLYALLRDHKDHDEVLARFWDQVHSVPEWVDWQQIARGQECFHRYGLPMVRALKSLSLIGGMAASRIVETLYRTGGFSPKAARRRVMETAQHVAQVTQSLESIQPGGAGHVSSIRVRLLHATVRRHILKLAQARPEYYDVKAFGVPANDLDSIATIGAFSSLLIWKGLPRQGVLMRAQEVDDYIALWRLVAHYLGTPTEPYESAETARAWLESIVAAEMKPNDKSAVMANNIITAMANTPPAYVSLEFSRVTARWLNGRELSDSLKIGNAGWYHWALLLGTNIFMATWVYFTRAFPAIDKWQIAMSRKEGWENLMDEKNGIGKETKFTFEHVPGYSKETDVAQPPEQQSSWKFKPGIEMMGALGLLMATMVLFAVLVAGVGVMLQLHSFLTAQYVTSN